MRIDHRKYLNYLLCSNRLDYVRNYSPDRAAFVFDFDSNLTPLFHWNVKVLHVMLYAEYKTDSNELNQVILWDDILERKYLLEGRQSAHLRYGFLNGKYTLIDYGNELRDKTITLKLRWNVVPYVGLLYDQEAVVGQYLLPKQYKRSGPERAKVVYDETYDEELIRSHFSQQ